MKRTARAMKVSNIAYLMEGYLTGAQGGGRRAQGAGGRAQGAGDVLANARRADDAARRVDAAENGALEVFELPLQRGSSPSRAPAARVPSHARQRYLAVA